MVSYGTCNSVANQIKGDHMATAKETAAKPEWIGPKQVAEILGLQAKNIPRLAAKGVITTRPLPGVRAIYLKSDVERLAVESIRPATA
jgi:hypothetical protein